MNSLALKGIQETQFFVKTRFITTILMKLGIASVFLFLLACGNSGPAANKSETALEHAAKHLNSKYVCPMHPQIIRDAPGKCPICGMTLVKKELEPPQPEKIVEKSKESQTVKNNKPQEKPVITLNAKTVQNMGIRTATVNVGTLDKAIKTVGYVNYDQNRITHVHSRANGWVEKLLVRAEGDVVKRGDVLLELYSPEILAAQEEYLVSLRMGKSKLLGEGSEPLKNSARERLRLLQVPDNVIQQIETTGKAKGTITINTLQTGVVTRLGIREGMYITPEMELFTITDISSVWVLVDVFEHQLAWLRIGQSVTIEVTAMSGQRWQGEVDYIYPELDPKTRTLKVRLRFANPKGSLKPNMFAQVTIAGGEKRSVIKIPQEALILTGERKSVIKVLAEGQFQPVDVTTGISNQGEVEILSGVSKGDKVVISGQFLIDSEANLRASFQRLEGTQDSGTAHRH